MLVDIVGIVWSLCWWALWHEWFVELENWSTRVVLSWDRMCVLTTRTKGQVARRVICILAGMRAIASSCVFVVLVSVAVSDERKRG